MKREAEDDDTAAAAKVSKWDVGAAVADAVPGMMMAAGAGLAPLCDLLGAPSSTPASTIESVMAANPACVDGPVRSLTNRHAR